MKQNFAKVLAIGAACILLSAFLFAQENKNLSPSDSEYLISAKAGGVNFVSGKVAVVRKKGKSGYLVKGDALEIGDKVLTGSGGRAEILLNPGSFVRLSGNSEFEFVSTDLDDLQVRVNGGSAIFEVITVNQFKVAINTPKSRFYIVKSGVYRVDAKSDGTDKIEVWKGKAEVAGSRAAVIKGGQTTVGNEGQLAIEKFDRDNKDEFVSWSRERAKELDKINAKLRRREMNQALLSTFSESGWNSYRSLGLWVRDPWSRSFCFLPFGYGWYSPYGFGYNRSIWNYQMPSNNSNFNVPYYGQTPMNPPSSNPGSGFPRQPGGYSPIISEPSRPVIDRPSIIERKEEPRMVEPKDQ